VDGIGSSVELQQAERLKLVDQQHRAGPEAVEI
jgi:hypothetical protein